MTDLERLFRHLVSSLSTTDPSRLRGPLQLREIRDSILPYRAHRRALQLESSEDYELALMCLCAGLDGYARTEPESIRAAFADEIESPNPDLSLLQLHEHAVVTLNSEAIARVMTPADPHESFAPPAPIEVSADHPPKRQAVQDANRHPSKQCARCRGSLPESRPVNFCPHCGFDLRRGYCPQCNAELDPEWRHCVSCGLALSKA